MWYDICWYFVWVRSSEAVQLLCKLVKWSEYIVCGSLREWQHAVSLSAVYMLVTQLFAVCLLTLIG